MLVYSSSRNRFLRNTCICGGDGIFVAGYDHKGNQGPCNDNLFEENDCRYSSNNAIESTFSRGNIFRRNDCSRSNYGFWMGYSWENTIEDNTIEMNHFVGIAVEHGFDFTIRNNRIRQNEEGVRLWTRGGPVVDHWPGHEVSYNFRLENNLIEGNRIGFYGYTGAETTDQECHDYHLRGNTIRDNRVGARFARVHACSVEGNQFTGNVEEAIQLVDEPGVTVGANTIEGSQGVVPGLTPGPSPQRWRRESVEGVNKPAGRPGRPYKCHAGSAALWQAADASQVPLRLRGGIQGGVNVIDQKPHARARGGWTGPPTGCNRNTDPTTRSPTARSRRPDTDAGSPA